MTSENFVKGKRLVLQMRVNVNTKGKNIANSQTFSNSALYGVKTFCCKYTTFVNILTFEEMRVNVNTKVGTLEELRARKQLELAGKVPKH